MTKVKKKIETAEQIKDLVLFDCEVIAFDDLTDAEKAKRGKNGSVLAVVKGYATLSDNKDNRNKHFYPKGFWKSVLDKNSSVEERLATGTFFGEAKHPEKGESPIPEFGQNISHKFIDFKIDDKGVYVEADVLNTDAGRAIKTFIDSGSKIGISTRAYGEVDIDKEGYKTPKLDRYFFVTWDFVSFPAFSETRMEASKDSYELPIETIKKSASKDAMMDAIKKMSRREAKVICDSAGLDYKEVLGDSAEENEQEVALDQAMDRIKELETQLKDSTGDKPADYKKVEDGYKKKILDMNNTIKGLTTKNKELQGQVDSLNKENPRLTKVYDNKISILKSKVITLEQERDSVTTKLNDLKDIVDNRAGRTAEVQEELELLQDAYDDATEEINKLKKLNIQLQDKIKNLHTKSEQVSDSETQNPTTERVSRNQPMFDSYDSEKVDTEDAEIDDIRQVIRKLKN
jgi:phage shock protein A